MAAPFVYQWRLFDCIRHVSPDSPSSERPQWVPCWRHRRPYWRTDRNASAISLRYGHPQPSGTAQFQPELGKPVIVGMRHGLPGAASTKPCVCQAAITVSGHFQPASATTSSKSTGQDHHAVRDDINGSKMRLPCQQIGSWHGELQCSGPILQLHHNQTAGGRV